MLSILEIYKIDHLQNCIIIKCIKKFYSVLTQVDFFYYTLYGTDCLFDQTSLIYDIGNKYHIFQLYQKEISNIVVSSPFLSL